MHAEAARGARRLFDAVARPPYQAARGLGNRYIDRRFGLRTFGEIDLEELGLAGPERERYKPTEWLTLPRILPKREVGPEDVFVDFGSGLGRVVFQAARRYPLKRVVGVELSEQLSAVARENIERARRHLRCQDVELVTSDALSFSIPEDTTIAFFANPFQGATFAAVVDRLLETLPPRPRRLRIVYRNPVEHAYLMSTGRFRVVRKLHGLRPGREWSTSNSTTLYEVVGPPV